MRILGLIPARGGSKGIPGKNVKLLGQKPLLAYTADAANTASSLSRVIVSTEDDAIISVSREFGLDVPFVRPDELAADHSPTLGVIVHALEWLADKGEHYDAVCLLQVTTPFRKAGFIDEAVRKFINSGADSLVSVLRVPHEYNPHWTFEDRDGLLRIATGETEIIGRRQDLPQAWHRDGSLYLTKSSVLHAGSLYGKTTAYIENDPAYHVNLDTFSDWEKAEKLVGNLFPK